MAFSAVDKQVSCVGHWSFNPAARALGPPGKVRCIVSLFRLPAAIRRIPMHPSSGGRAELTSLIEARKKRGRLVVERIAGKDYTTLANIERMRELCRVEIKAPDRQPTSLATPRLRAPSGISELTLMTPCRSRNRWTSDLSGREGSVPPEPPRSLDTNHAAYACRHKQVR